MKLIYRILLALPAFMLWILMFLFTMNKRSEFMAAESKGMYCTGSENNLNSTTYHFDPTRKPERMYPTWREFWSKFGYYHGN